MVDPVILAAASAGLLGVGIASTAMLRWKRGSS